MAKQFGDFKIYPRGFLGVKLSDRIENTQQPFKELLHAHQFHTDMFKQPTGIDDANPNVEYLYAQYIKHAPNTTSFAFRENVLRVALMAFGTPDFYIWFVNQHKSPATGDMHRRFLDDTLRFIIKGRREICLENWNPLLNISDTGGNLCIMSEYAKTFFGINDEVNGFSSISVVDIIQRWCSKSGGIEDLLGTLHILFGNVDISNK